MVWVSVHFRLLRRLDGLGATANLLWCVTQHGAFTGLTNFIRHKDNGLDTQWSENLDERPHRRWRIFHERW